AYLPDDLVSVGRDTETVALSKAVKYFVEHRVFLNDDRTVVFK
ncbi:formyltetrahydrofolate deformylase, partial [Acinetobacter baumannii]